MAEPRPVPLVDLAAQRDRLGARIDEAVAAVLDHGQFILGPEVTRLEGELAARCGVGHAVACSSGTDALLLGMLALGVGAGDAVIVPSFTFAATAEAVVRAGATPVFVDVDERTATLHPTGVGAAAAWAEAAGLRAAGVVPVDLYGLPADYAGIGKAAAERGMWVLADAAQSFGAAVDGRPVGSLAPVTATSFFPAKPLGCYGDGGAVLTDHEDVAAAIRSLRVHGRVGGGDYTAVGINGRLDTLQAAILLAKLEVFDDELQRRQAVAARYAAGLEGTVATPAGVEATVAAWACYTVRTPGRDRVVEELRRQGIASAVYYRTPLHRTAAYARYPVGPGGLPGTDRLAASVVSLPMSPYLSPPDQDRVVQAVRASTGRT